MDSFLESNYRIIYKGVEIFAALVGIILLRKYRKDKAAKYFIYFLIYIQVIETFGSYTIYIRKYESLNWIVNIVKGTIFQQNYWWYTVFWSIGSSVFFGLYFYLVSITPRIKFIVKWVSIFCVLLSVFLFVFNIEVFKNNYLIFLDLINFLLIIFLVFSYFLELLYSDKFLLFYKSLPFYVAVGIFIFTIVTTPLLFYEEYYNTSDQGFIFLKSAIKLMAITITYLTFAIGLIVSKLEKK